MKKPLCAAIGDFDGIHIGHAKVIETAVSLSDSYTPIVYTFEENCKKSPILTDNVTKSRILYSMGIKEIIYDDFMCIKDLSPTEFVKNILIDKYNIECIVCGEDFTFGKNANGNIETLKSICDSLGVKLLVVNCLFSKGKKISSTEIRGAIELGNMEKASALLGRPFQISGNVVHGKNIAHNHDTPTININFDTKSIIPAYGVYISQTIVGNKVYNSITNVGVRPSIESTNIPNIETNIFDFNSQIYDQNVSVCFLKMIRPEIKFDTKSKLFDQIKKDINAAKQFFLGEN